jgi:hypothetical protein
MADANIFGLCRDTLGMITDRLRPADLAAFAMTNKAGNELAGSTEYMLFRKRCPWPRDTKNVCSHAAEYGNLAMLKWLRSVGSEWDSSTISHAIRRGHKDMIRWVRAQNPPCPWPEDACCLAMMSSPGMLIWVVDQGCQVNKVDMLEQCIMWAGPSMWQNLHFLRGAGCEADEVTMAAAAESGNLEVVRWLYVSIRCPWNELTCARRAASNGHAHILKWARSI